MVLEAFDDAFDLFRPRRVLHPTDGQMWRERPLLLLETEAGALFFQYLGHVT